MGGGKRLNKQGSYKMNTVSRLTGFAPGLLRAWERRHGLLVPQRSEGGHRFYTDDDIRVLRRVRSLIGEGRAIGEIAAIGRDALLESSRELQSPLTAPRYIAPEPAAGNGLASLRETIVRAALETDKARLDRSLDQVFAIVSPNIAIEQVIQPAAKEIGDLWVAGRCDVASEHLASEAFSHRLRKLIESASSLQPSDRILVCACFPEERHELGLLILIYGLLRKKWDIVYLGAALPFHDLVAACRRIHPRAVLLSVTLDQTYRKHREALVATEGLRDFRVVVGGLGVPMQDEEVTRAGLVLWSAEKGSTGLEQHLTGPD